MATNGHLSKKLEAVYVDQIHLFIVRKVLTRFILKKQNITRGKMRKVFRKKTLVSK